MAITNNEFWQNFVEAYREEAVLWEPTNKWYKKKSKRLRSWERILNIYKEVEPKATIHVVKRKINSMRGCYKRELAKVKESERLALGVEDVYVPSLWYFEKFDFLRELDQDCDSFEQEYSIEDRKIKNVTIERQTKSDPEIKKINVRKRYPEPILNTLNVESKIPPKMRKYERDEADIFAESWAVLFRKLSADQKIYAKRGIEELLLQGQLGNLNMNLYMQM